jgi:hypothetical protein
MFKVNLILFAGLFLTLSCAQTTKNHQKQTNTDSLQVSVNLPNNKQGAIAENDNFYYSDDATISNEEWEEDTLSGYIEPKLIDSANFTYKLKPSVNYNKMKASIIAERLRLNKLYLSKKDSVWKKRILDSARNYVTSTLLNKIIPHWYGMPWDFSGYSAVPQKGEVGCSYFISNTLLNMGFNVNRYKLAQQGPENETKSLDQNYKSYLADEDFSYDKMNMTLLNQMVKENKKGLYFVGLSNHVGYLLIHENDLFFIHSNYGTLKVMLEYAETSEEFMDSQYYIAGITYNDDLIRKWLLNEEIKVFRD